METARKINSLVLLRAIAVTCVCFGHLGYALVVGNSLSATYSIMHEYGKYGVYIFFVVSGFIIPLSMDKARYDIKYFFKFLAKRAVRLHLPYLVAFVMAVIILFADVWVKHVPFPYSFITVVLDFLSWKRIVDNPVFWTLRVEAEFYVLMGLYFPLLKRYPNITLAISIPLILVLSRVMPPMALDLPDYLVFFWIGVIAYVVYEKAAPQILALSCLLVLVSGTFLFYVLPIGMVVLITVLVILLYKSEGNRIANSVGEMSYSIYLVHYPIGVKLINLVYLHFSHRYSTLLFLLANTVALTASAIFWKLVEVPFANLSNKIKYGGARHRPKTTLV